VDQALSVLDAAQARDDGKDMGQKQVGGMIVPVIVIGPPHELLQEAANCKTPAKGVKQAQPTKAGEAASFEGEIEFPGTFGHIPQTYLKGRFVESPNYIDVTRYSYASTPTRQAVDSRFSGIVN
jgi:hypothetical protein